MNLIEFQGKQLLKRNGIAVPNHVYIKIPEELKKLCYPVMLKSQVLTGQRGKNGGILRADSYEQAVELYSILKDRPIKGLMPFGVLAEETASIRRELYFSIAFNRRAKCVTMMYSEFGGMNIEEIEPEKIKRVDIDPLLGIQRYSLVKLMQGSQLDKGIQDQISKLAVSLMGVYQTYGLELLEINPLVVTEENKVMALDAKITIDDNARRESEGEFDALTGGTGLENPVEAVSKLLGVNGVRLDGGISVITSGAGVGMASIDTIKDHRGTVHSFVDLGALIYDEEAMVKIIETILDEKPQAFLFNFFFQVGSCDVIAKAIVRSLGSVRNEIPIVVRARGKRLEESKQILEQIGLTVTEDFTEACNLICEMARGEKKWQSS